MSRKENNEKKNTLIWNDDDDNDSDNRSPRDITRVLKFVLVNQWSTFIDKKNEFFQLPDCTYLVNALASYIVSNV